MALIECPDCGRQVSSLADKCPNCNRPINPQTSTPLQVSQPVLRQCFECGGSGRIPIECPSCGGSGYLTCIGCMGEGRKFSTAISDYIVCRVCNGAGTQPCDRCQGTRVIKGEAKCPICGGSGQLTYEEYEAKQQQQEDAKRRAQEEAKRRAEEAAEAARRYAEDASLRAAARAAARREADTPKQFLYSWIGAVMGFIPSAVILWKSQADYYASGRFSGDSLANGAILGIIAPAAGAAIGLQIYFGKTKQCIGKAFLFALMANAIGLVALFLVASIRTEGMIDFVGIIFLLLIAVLTAGGALLGGRKS